MKYVIYKIDNNRKLNGKQDYYMYVAEVHNTQYLTSRLSDARLYNTYYSANYFRVRDNYMNDWDVRGITDKELFKAKLGNT